MEINQQSPTENPAVLTLQTAEMSAWQMAVRLAAQATPQLAEVIQTFWGAPITLHLFAVSLESHYYWRQDDFHVSQLVLGDAGQSSAPANTALLRISDTTCSALLGSVLGDRGSSQKPFDFRQISPLEAAILNDFSRDLLASLMKTLLKKNGAENSPEQLHFLWTLRVGPDGETSTPLSQGAPFEVGKIVLSVPPSCLKLSSPELPEHPGIPDDFFFHVLSAARVRIGQTRLPLSELNGLEPGDWVVLEDSDIQRMALVDPQSGVALSFSVEMPQKQKLTVPYTQELAMMETQQAEARQNLWDNLMIEVNAEFAPVKLPLKQLKQMSEGLVVEVGDLTHNQIALQVEGKTLAWGELIIVGDKFGVRLTKVEGLEKSTGMAVVPAEAAKPDSDETVSNESAPDNEDDLDNFLNDSFDDEEEW